jgi:hypothetical protein
MRIARVCVGLILVFFCVCLRAATQEQKATSDQKPGQRMSVTGKLERVMAIGGETTGWAIQLESEMTIDGKRVNSIEIDYHGPKKLEELENKRVKAIGKLTHRHGVETGDRPVLEVSSIIEG